MRNKSMKFTATKAALTAALALGSVMVSMPAHAVWFATEPTQVVSWAAQYQQMVEEYKKLEETYNSLNGARGMQSLLDSAAARQYLPKDFQEILQNGYANWKDLEKTYSDIKNIKELNAKRIANYAKIEAAQQAGYRQAAARFEKIQKLIEKMKDAHDAKDIADLNAAINLEQANIQNERNKLAMLQQLAAQEDTKNNARTMELSAEAGRSNGALFNYDEAKQNLLNFESKKTPTSLK